jgi:hypothetical protein
VGGGANAAWAPNGRVLWRERRKGIDETAHAVMRGAGRPPRRAAGGRSAAGAAARVPRCPRRQRGHPASHLPPRLSPLGTPGAGYTTRAPHGGAGGAAAAHMPRVPWRASQSSVQARSTRPPSPRGLRRAHTRGRVRARARRAALRRAAAAAPEHAAAGAERAGAAAGLCGDGPLAVG